MCHWTITRHLDPALAAGAADTVDGIHQACSPLTQARPKSEQAPKAPSPDPPHQQREKLDSEKVNSFSDKLVHSRLSLRYP